MSPRDDSDDMEFQHDYENDYDDDDDDKNLELQLLCKFATLKYQQDMEQVTSVTARIGDARLRVYHDRAVLKALEIISEVKPFTIDELLRIKNELDKMFDEHETINSEKEPPPPSPGISGDGDDVEIQDTDDKCMSTAVEVLGGHNPQENNETDEGDSEDENDDKIIFETNTDLRTWDVNQAEVTFHAGAASEFHGSVTAANTIHNTTVTHGNQSSSTTYIFNLPNQNQNPANPQPNLVKEVRKLQKKIKTRRHVPILILQRKEEIKMVEAQLNPIESDPIEVISIDMDDTNVNPINTDDVNLNPIQMNDVGINTFEMKDANVNLIKVDDLKANLVKTEDNSLKNYIEIFDRVVYIDANDHAAIKAFFLELANKLKIVTYDEEYTRQLESKSILNKIYNILCVKKCLFVFEVNYDNFGEDPAESIKVYLPDLESLLPDCIRPQVVITPKIKKDREFNNSNGINEDNILESESLLFECTSPEDTIPLKMKENFEDYSADNVEVNSLESELPLSGRTSPHLLVINPEIKGNSANSNQACPEESKTLLSGPTPPCSDITPKIKGKEEFEKSFFTSLYVCSAIFVITAVFLNILSNRMNS